MNIIIFIERTQMGKIVGRLSKTFSAFADEQYIIRKEANLVTVFSGRTVVKFLPLSETARGYAADILLIPKQYKGTQLDNTIAKPMCKGLMYYYEED